MKKALNDDTYFEDIDYISNSDLSLLKYSPRAFDAKKNGKWTNLPTPEMQLGSAIHTFVLEPDKFDEKYIVFNGQKPANPQQNAFVNAIIFKEIDPITAYAACYSIKGKSEKSIKEDAEKLHETLGKYIEATKAGKILVSNSDYEMAIKIKTEISLHKRASSLLYGDNGIRRIEDIIVFDYADIPCKSKLDLWLYEDKVAYVVDYKTTNNLKFFKDTFYKLEYDRQLAFYTLALKSKAEEEGLFPVNKVRWEWKIIASETQGFNECKVFNIDVDTINNGFKKVDELISKLILHRKYGFEYDISYYEGDGEEDIIYEEK